MQTQTHDPCPRCAARGLRAWAELTDDEREVARRLPALVKVDDDDARARRRFCARCWHVEADDSPRDA